MSACKNIHKAKQAIHQAWILTWHKQFILSWQSGSYRTLVYTLLTDIGVPVVLVYVYLLNLLDNPHRTKMQPSFDPMHLRESMDSAMSNMLLPIAFFAYCRKSIGQIVLEKEKGMQEYLIMNGMSQTAYNLSFIMHESFVNGPLICFTLDCLVKWRMTPQNQPTIINLLCFNVSMILYIAGTTAMALLISKGFNTSGFATQIGSMMYLMPIFLSLYLQVLKMKHDFAAKSNQEFGSMEDQMFQPGSRGQDFVQPVPENDAPLYPEDLQAEARRQEVDVEEMHIEMSNSSRNATKEEERWQLVEAEEYFWEKYARQSISLFPHSPFCDASLLCFANNPMADVINCYLLQIFDAALFIFLVMLIENHFSFFKMIRNAIFGQPSQESDRLKKSGQYDSLKRNEDVELTEQMIEGSDEIQEGQKGKPKRRRSPNGNHVNQPADAALIQKTVPAIQYIDMTKKYDSFVAVDQLNLNLYKNEIFCFLGHNGAGKTTALNVLMGKVQPSLGTILLNLKNAGAKIDIRDDIEEAQACMGVCSQHDTLFETLTVEQHIYLFFQLKSKLISSKPGSRTIKQRVDELIQTVALDSHRHVQSQNLSGGLRRRLSIALALASPSESSIVILDEPTTALDAIVRDQVWQLIKSLRKNRCIVMTTQHLQEAEELADRVALLDLGKMVAKGSVDEIKKMFGIGYNLIVNQQDDPSIKYEKEILNSIPGAYKDEKNSNEQKSYYILPFSAVELFPNLFEKLEQLNLKFTLKQTSLEDAFLNYTNLKNAKDPNSDPESQTSQFGNYDNLKIMDNNIPFDELTGPQLFQMQVYAMFLKRWYSFKRDWRMWLLMVLPSLLISCFLLLGFQREYKPGETLSFTNQLLGQNNTNGTFYDTDSINSAMKSIAKFTNHNDRRNGLDLDQTSPEYLKETFANPTMENIIKSMVNFQDDDSIDDPDIKEIQQLVKSVVKEDLELDNPFAIIAYGVKLFAQSEEERTEEMKKVKDKVQDRFKQYYEKKMRPIFRKMLKEQQELMLIEAIRYMKEIIYLIWMIFSIAQCSGIAIENPVLERELNIRYYLNVLGIGQVAYWLGNFLFDLICYLIQASIMVALVYPLKLTAYQNQIYKFIAIMAIFGPAHILFSYFLSFAFKKPTSALKFISIIYMIAGFILPFIFKIISVGLTRCEAYTYRISQVVSQFVPLQPMSAGMVDLVLEGHEGLWAEQTMERDKALNATKELYEREGREMKPAAKFFDNYQSCDGYVFDFETAMIAMAISIVASIVLILMIEQVKLFFYQSSEQKYEPSNDIDYNDKGKFLQTRNLTKTYAGNIKAVQNISFDLNSKQEILGLLGSNGAGKSSTFNMVTMQIQRTSGDISIFNESITGIKSLQHVNITAQHDILWPYLSIYEHFKVISLVTGQPNFSRRFEKLKQMLELDKPHKYACILSGGNKRKLCTALTLLTQPKLAYFDEPTVGLDPVSRRNLLNLIKKCGASVLFTTHRLDEAEYLCTRVAIMQKGKILYDGNIEDIKSSYQNGEIAGADQNGKRLYQGLILVKHQKEDLSKRFTYLEIDQEDVSQCLYRIIHDKGSFIELSQIFRDFNELKNKGLINDFSYFEPSLHHAFVAISTEESRSKSE